MSGSDIWQFGVEALKVTCHTLFPVATKTVPEGAPPAVSWSEDAVGGSYS